jgi:hypothetical protein
MPGTNLLGSCADCCPPLAVELGDCESVTASSVFLCGIAGYVSDPRALPPDERFFFNETRSGFSTECLVNKGTGCLGTVGASNTTDYSGSQSISPPSSCSALGLGFGGTITGGCGRTSSGTFPTTHPAFPGTPVVDTPTTRQYLNTGSCQDNGIVDGYQEWDILFELTNPDSTFAAISRGTHTDGTDCAASTPAESIDGRTLSGTVTAVSFYLQFTSPFYSTTQDVRITYRTTDLSTSAFDDSLTDDVTVSVDSGGVAGPITMPQPPAGFTRQVIGLEVLP